MGSLEVEITNTDVRSGNGAHLYWLLDQPIEFDDYDGPPKPLLRELDEGRLDAAILALPVAGLIARARARESER